MPIDNLRQILRDVIAGDKEKLAFLLSSHQESILSSDETDEVHAYLKALASTAPHAIYIRAILYDNGVGVKADNAIAFLLMREAASKGDSLAIYEVGHRFLLGIGVEQNYQNAFQWLSIASDSPHYVILAMEDLSEMYAKGLGVDADRDQAKHWAEEAAKHR